MNYPGRVIKKGDKDPKVVKAVQKMLNENGCGTLEVDGDFGNNTYNAVKVFQSRFPDQNGNPLVVDGKIGPLSWAILFGEGKVPVSEPPKSEIIKNVLAIAAGEIGVMEEPVGTNSGPEVDGYLECVGLGPGCSWCAAFVYWCYNEACKKSGKKNPVYKTAGVLSHWNNSSAKKITWQNAFEDPSLVKPGQVFIMSYGGGLGHTGIVEKVNGGFLTTIEGNTNDGGSREGIGVFRRTGRKIKDINKGFLQY
ncbi:MAG: CHAP domain-containing protein [Ignavibacteria bacterium]